TGRSAKRYSPWVLLAAARETPVEGFSSLTAAPAMVAPDPSVMTPEMLPRKVCAGTAAAMRKNAGVRTRCIARSLLLKLRTETVHNLVRLWTSEGPRERHPIWNIGYQTHPDLRPGGA